MKYLSQLIAQDKKGIVFLLLRPLIYAFSFIYYLAIRFILGAYRIGIFARYRLNCVVISVGNITWGGTGKTPLVEMLVRRFSSEGYKVAILSRGYKKSLAPRPSPVAGDNIRNTEYEMWNTVREMGDEPYLLKKNLPHIPVLVGKDRVATGRKAIKEYNVNTIILDDGFQYWRLYRDLDIVTINVCSAFGNSYLLPRGILREPLCSLKRADIFMLTKADLEKKDLLNLRERLKQINPRALIVESVHQPVELYDFDGVKAALEELRGREVCLLSSIADPISFEKTVSNLGAVISLKFQFPDHYDYQPEDIKRVIKACTERGIKEIITTEKDAVRLSAYRVQSREEKIQIFILRIEIRIIKNEREFFDRLHSLLGY
jgi:tetraacyldisaccharide 4'-kinase